MILSNLDIHKAIDRQWLKVSPEPAPRQQVEGSVKCPYQTSAVDLTLGNENAYFKTG